MIAMNAPRSLCMSFLLLGALAALASAQNSAVRVGFDSAKPPAEKAPASFPDAGPVLVMQNLLTLETAPPAADSCADGGETARHLDFVMVPREDDGTRLALLAARYRRCGIPSGIRDCPALALSILQGARSMPEQVLELVEVEIAANPSCACEIVKSAIGGVGADPRLVAGIVETSIVAAPEHMRLISQCAMAAAPDAIASVQAILAKFDPCTGDSGANAKTAKCALIEDVALKVPGALPNPLDLPRLLLLPPAPIHPPLVTSVDP